MKHIQHSEVPWVEHRSPRGRFHLFRRHLSEALGAPRDAGTTGGGHPFDVEMVRLPPGATNFPHHQHSAQWEFYLVLAGNGEVRAGETSAPVAAGESFICPPGEPHQLRNTGNEDLLYLVVADNAPADVVYYPDSDKWAIKPQRKVFRLQEADYFEGEE